jgi:signal transduction histidine kinase
MAAKPLRRLVGAAGISFWLSLQAVSSQTPNPLPVADRVLTNIYEIWSLPREQKVLAHRIQTEVVVYFFDSEWNNAWGECQGQPAYLPIADCPIRLKAGQRVAIDGLIMPMRERFIWDKTQVRILEEAVERKAEPVQDLEGDPQAYKAHLLSVEGLVDRLLEDPTHITITLLAGNVIASAYVLKHTNGPSLDLKAGDFVRIRCVYSPQLDRNGKVSDLSLFIGQPEDIEVIGSLATDPRFVGPITSIQEIQTDLPSNNLLHVEGIVRSHEQGKWVTLWDASGQVMVQSRQTQPLRYGDVVEAVGYPYALGVQQCLRGGVYRMSTSTNRVALAPEDVSEKSPLRMAARIRDLSRQEAERRLPVNLRAIVTWAHGQTPFAYVQDASGGIRVVSPTWQGSDTSKAGTIVDVRGEVGEGDFVPVVTNAVISRVGWWNLDEARRVTLEEALTGVHDGRWVEMRGFVRQATRLGGLVRFDLTTSSGEFEVWTPATEAFESWRGSIVRVQGVCAAVSNARHQLTGIQIWAPEVKNLYVEEAAPDDPFAAPLRSLDSLRRFNSQNALNQRVRTLGTVVLHVPGSHLYVQEGVDSVLALSQQPDRLQPGDRVEVVGFPGNEGRRFLLREAVYRRISSGAELDPVQLSVTHAANPDLEGLLAKAEGILLNIVNKEGEARLLVRTKDSTFEASLSSTRADDAEAFQTLKVGSRLGVKGVYQVQSDEYGKPRSFLLRQRSSSDVLILQQPPWWTLARLLWVLVAVLAVSVLALNWGILLSRKNALLRQAQTELQAANDKLELRVQERTRELQEQVVAKERARAELADAQKRLIMASRHAGMAEVATGVLHNVGNVLNSVNVSVALVTDKVAHSAIANLERVVALLREHQNDLDQFLNRDPKGTKLIDYLEALNTHLAAEKGQLVAELGSLARNVDHIKEIVSMQQSYAQTSGVLELLEPAELIEDALKMHAAAYQRHAVEVVREFAKVPPITVDRHKTLQVLANLLHNAKYACAGQATGSRKVTVRLAPLKTDRIRIEVADSGMGIPPENLTRIFSFGFTTRKDGHGFGLHSGALAAKEMGGSLTAYSEGSGKGATFVFELPTRNGTGAEPPA